MNLRARKISRPLRALMIGAFLYGMVIFALPSAYRGFLMSIGLIRIPHTLDEHLYDAADMGDARAVRKYLALGADPNYRFDDCGPIGFGDPPNWMTPLRIAKQHKDRRIIQILEQAGAKEAAD